MSIFKYEAKRGPAEVIEGELEAENEQMAISRVRKMGYYPVSIREYNPLRYDFKDKIFHLWRKVKPGEVSIFTRQLSNLINAGLPFMESLNIISSQTGNPNLKRVIEDLKNQVQNGSPFSKSLSLYPDIFSPLYVSMTTAGEAGGMLGEVLERLANSSEEEEELKSKVRAALAYPILLICMGFGTIFVLTTFVIPRFVTMFRDVGQALPLPTRLLINFSNFMNNFWWLVIGLILIGSVIMGRYYRTEKGRKLSDTFKLRVPLFGDLFLKIEISRFSRILGTLLENGVPIINALDIVASTVSNQIIADEVSNISKQVREGEKLANALKKSSHFPPVVVNMIGVGEESGHLEAMLLKVAHAFDIEVDRKVKTLTALLEPVMIVVLGGIVGFIVMAMLLPIFKMNVLVK